MLYYALVFLVVGLIANLLGAGVVLRAVDAVDAVGVRGDGVHVRGSRQFQPQREQEFPAARQGRLGAADPQGV